MEFDLWVASISIIVVVVCVVATMWFLRMTPNKLIAACVELAEQGWKPVLLGKGVIRFPAREGEGLNQRECCPIEAVCFGISGTGAYPDGSVRYYIDAASRLSMSRSSRDLVIEAMDSFLLMSDNAEILRKRFLEAVVFSEEAA